MKHSTLDEFKTYLTNNPISVQYILLTPVFEPFEDQTSFYNLKSQNTVTNIFFVGESNNVNPSAILRIPANDEGALATTSFCEERKNNIVLTKTIESQQKEIDELKETIASMKTDLSTLINQP